MQITAEVNWNTADFLVAGVLLLGTGLMGDLIWRKVKNNKRKVLLTLGLNVFLITALGRTWGRYLWLSFGRKVRSLIIFLRNRIGASLLYNLGCIFAPWKHGTIMSCW
ncbi:hypothetical protein [Muriicola sp.]|uniref:hypothetical protein n=1 Tax=Muriicola sp. TaxID=2020856 RepID=UPI003C77E3F8